MNVKFRQFRLSDINEIKKLVKYFYRETPGNVKISDRKIKRTCREFTVHPEKGTIIIFEFEKSIIGYAILFYGWSNEQSKDLIFIDELYVNKLFRNKGIASDFIKYIIKKLKNKVAALMLAVENGNEKVENLYRKSGFKLYKNKTLVYKF
ncbi:MAG: GNAT family N-acetyltransferase [Patescibacteria group bacterium]|nr:GNAT family N-acetyltransferase [Patescibacteria group bacterium]